MNTQATIPERVAVLEQDSEVCHEQRLDVEQRLRRIERLMWGIVALQLGLKFLL